MQKLIFILGCLVFAIPAYSQSHKAKAKKAQPSKAQHATPKEQPRNDNFTVTETQEVSFPGTDQELVGYFMDNLVFDDASVAANAEGEVTLSFVVNFDSTVVNPLVVKKFGYNVDDQMVELVKKLKFIPARMNGVLIKQNHMISIPLRAYKK